MKLKKFIALMMALCFILMACAPAAGNPDATTDATTGGSTEATTAATTEEPAYVFDALTLAGEDISKYKIVYAPALLSSLARRYRDVLAPEYQYYQIVANRLAELIKEKFDITLEVVMDEDEITKGTYEILVGPTNRTESKTLMASKTFSVDDYTIAVSNSKLVIYGGSAGSTWHSIEEFEKMFKEAEDNKATTVEIAADKKINGTYKMKHIACIGDSYVGGSKASHDELKFPQQLQRFVWRDYMVYNDGIGGSDMRDDLQYKPNPYNQTTQYKNLLARNVKYDLVIMHLGGNDAWKHGVPLPGDQRHIWSEANDAYFFECYKKIIDSIKNHSPNTKFVTMKCVWLDSKTYYGVEHVKVLQENGARTLKAAGYDMYLYDAWAMSLDHFTPDLYADDKIHVNDKGYLVFAGLMYDLVRAVMDGEENKYMIDIS